MVWADLPKNAVPCKYQFLFFSHAFFFSSFSQGFVLYFMSLFSTECTLLYCNSVTVDLWLTMSALAWTKLPCIFGCKRGLRSAVLFALSKLKWEFNNVVGGLDMQSNVPKVETCTVILFKGSKESLYLSVWLNVSSVLTIVNTCHQSPSLALYSNATVNCEIQNTVH